MYYTAKSDDQDCSRERMEAALLQQLDEKMREMEGQGTNKIAWSKHLTIANRFFSLELLWDVTATQKSYLLGLLAKIKCSICSYQLNL
jgi:hypothetical protein